MFGADRYNPAPLDLGGAELASMLSGNFSASPTYEVHAAEPLVTTAIANSGLSPAREVTASGGLTYEEAFNLAPRGKTITEAQLRGLAMEPGSGSAWLTLVLAGLISFAVIKTLESKESL